MKKYYINSFNFFYGKNEDLGNKFSKSAYGENYTSESDDFELSVCLSMIANGFNENEQDFIDSNIDISDLIYGVLKKCF